MSYCAVTLKSDAGAETGVVGTEAKVTASEKLVKL
jgi:hypothetical protein